MVWVASIIRMNSGFEVAIDLVKSLFKLQINSSDNSDL